MKDKRAQKEKERQDAELLRQELKNGHRHPVCPPLPILEINTSTTKDGLLVIEVQDGPRLNTARRVRIEIDPTKPDSLDVAANVIIQMGNRAKPRSERIQVKKS